VTLWARKRAPRAPHGPPLPTALSPEAGTASSLGDSLFYPFFFLSFSFPVFAPATEIAHPHLITHHHRHHRRRPPSPPASFGTSPLSHLYMSPSSTHTLVSPCSPPSLLHHCHLLSSHLQPHHACPCHATALTPAAASQPHANPNHECLVLICPYVGMVYLTYFSCVVFSFSSCFH
jgi:hypothetical protein